MKSVENLFLDQIKEKSNRIKLIRKDCREDMKAYKSLEEISSIDGNLFRVMKTYGNALQMMTFKSEVAANIHYELSDRV